MTPSSPNPEDPQNLDLDEHRLDEIAAAVREHQMNPYGAPAGAQLRAVIAVGIWDVDDDSCQLATSTFDVETRGSLRGIDMVRPLVQLVGYVLEGEDS